MYFGEYLLKKNILSEDQLLEALIIQVEEMPSFLRVLRDEKVFSANEILKLIDLQLENDTDIIQVLLKEKKMGLEKLQELYLKQTEKRKMLGRIVVELKFTDQNTIEKMLHEYLRDKDNFSDKKESSSSSLAEPEISEAALESLRELGLSDSDFVKEKPAAPIAFSGPPVNNAEMSIFVSEYLDIFSDKMNKKFQKLIKFLTESLNDESDISNYYSTLYRDFFLLKGAALLGDLKISASILEGWSDMIEKRLKFDTDQLKEWTKVILPDMIASLNFLWETRIYISLNKSEESIKNSSGFEDKYSHLLSKIK